MTLKLEEVQERDEVDEDDVERERETKMWCTQSEGRETERKSFHSGLLIEPSSPHIHLSNTLCSCLRHYSWSKISALFIPDHKFAFHNHKENAPENQFEFCAFVCSIRMRWIHRYSRSPLHED